MGSCYSLQPVVKAELVQSLDGQTMVNSLYFVGTDPWSAAEATLLAADLKAWWVAGVMTYQTTATQLELIRITDMSDPEGFIVEYNTGLPVNGVNAVEPMPSNVAIVVSFRSGKRGRMNRGRVFLGGFGQSVVDINEVANDTSTALLSFFDDLQTEVALPNDAAHVIYSCRDVGGSPVGVPVVVTEYLVNPVVASQRRRLPGRGS